MKSDCAVFVDAGYLLAAAATTITGTSLRSGVAVDYQSLLQSVILEAERVSGVRVMRTQWYDAAPSGVPTSEQEQIGILPRVKLRLGRIGYDGQQKGVDLRIGLDMVGYARNGAVGTIVLVSGDDDLTVAVEEAQHQGVKVIILAVPDKDSIPHGVAKHLRLAADDLAMFNADLIAEAVKRRVTPPRADRPSVTAMQNETLAPRVVATPAAAAISDEDAAPPVPAVPLTTVPTPASIGLPPRNYSPDMPRRRPRSEMAYSSTTGGISTVSPRFADEQIYEEEIKAVATRVVSSFLASATDDSRRDVARNRPSIPQELDRALLLDLASVTDNYNLDDSVRRNLRAEFWEQIGARMSEAR